jgi:hypothetical protein
MPKKSVMSSRLRDLTESTEAEGRDGTHQQYLHNAIRKRNEGFPFPLVLPSRL